MKKIKTFEQEKNEFLLRKHWVSTQYLFFKRGVARKPLIYYMEL